MNLAKRVQRWRHDRCEHCGHRFHWRNDARHSFGNRDGKVYHAPCLAYLRWRSKADERLDMLALVCEVWAISDRDAKGVVEMRAESDDARVAGSNAAFRVFRDLSKRATTAKEGA